MSGEEQERFEDCLELETYLEELQAGHIVRYPRYTIGNEDRAWQLVRPDTAQQAMKKDIAIRIDLLYKIGAC